MAGVVLTDVVMDLSLKSFSLAMSGLLKKPVVWQSLRLSLEHCVEVFRFVGAAAAAVVSVRFGELFIFEAGSVSGLICAV